MEHGVGCLLVAECEADVADAVERHHTVLARRAVVFVAELLRDVQRAVVVVDCLVENAHASVVGADVVERLRHGDGVMQLFAERHLALVAVDGFHEEVVLAVGASQLAARTHLEHIVARLFGFFHKTVEALLALHATNDAVGAVALLSEASRRRLCAAGAEEKYENSTRCKENGASCWRTERLFTGLTQ